MTFFGRFGGRRKPPNTFDLAPHRFAPMLSQIAPKPLNRNQVFPSAHAVFAGLAGDSKSVC